MSPIRPCALLSANFSGWLRHIQACLDSGRQKFHCSIDTQRLAVFVLTATEGGVMQARTHRTLAAFDASIDSLKDYFDRLHSAALEESKLC